ncbi:MFS transporter [Streptomyces durmitorensis]|uniref:MFS transporter n=1 Tax=Streptomyces durmitorensis TaxID=319947 RepID=A0ABY4PTQ2_9ACTN|nr:MFS transporter [Streptomyces durmitorensis]UQT57136.1 MFS transporter [Streptomyces durmitorensis]
MTDELRRGRASLAFSFLVQGVTFALLVTRIPAIQDQYGISDGLLPVFLAAVPILAGVGSVGTEWLVKRVPPSRVLRWAQPVVLLALLGVGAGDTLWQVAVALGAFGLSVGALDASMNMLGVSLQRASGRSIMLGFHAAYSLGGIMGASAAWAGAHWDLSLFVSYLPVVVVLLPAALVGSRWYVDADAGADAAAAGEGKGGPVVFKLLLPLCLVMTFAYIGDSTVSNWSAKYLQDVLGSSEEVSTVPYNVYMVMTLLGRGLGDLGVRRFGAVAVVRVGSVVGALGFAIVAVAPGAWTGILGFTVLGLGLCVIVPQTFAAAGRLFPGASDAAVARLNVFNYVGFLIGSPLVGALGDAWNYRGAMLVPMVLVLVTLLYARSFAPETDRYGDGHERPRTADVGRGSNGL